ncbi:MAG TPA: asparagine synthase (glutamine-hydrolyzing) [Pyrinomonadaceae bacterium]|nr:asparagine synthase (glutamine-hydrolyzing) [Pyrinomonadaceae bacterium]
MCGIAGFIDFWEQKRNESFERGRLLKGMCDSIRHRGPDDEGFLLKDGVALGMRRLSIIDLAGGHQPISGEDGSVTIVFNGEIYSFHELRRELEQRGHTFKTNSDTEAIVHAYEEYGPACADHLRGMFAFAIWDDKKRELYIARDRVGKKPLYYTVTPGQTLVFGSEIKSILEHPDVEREINVDALDAYFTLGYVPDPLTIFQNIHKLPPGHHLTFSAGRVAVQQYWDFNFAPAESRKPEDYMEELRALLNESVRLRLISDVPLGAFLSGGIDSSTVVALMAQHMNQPVKTFSIGFHEDSYNELKYARLTAKKLGTDHHEFFVTPQICDIIDDLVWHFDEPFADPSAIPTFMVSKLARDHVTVALSGDGGDELFAGYTHYVVQESRRAFSALPKALREGVMRPLSYRLPHGAWGRNYLHNISLDPIDRYLDSLSYFTVLGKESLYTSDFQKQLRAKDQVARSFREYAARVKTNEPLDQLLYIDGKTYLPGDILTKVDRMSMATSLEVRVPLLDHKLIDFVTKVPASLKLAGTETKHLLKRVAKDLIPAEILDRPKQGFGMPLEEWINRQLRDQIREILREPRTRQRGYVNPDYVDLILDEHHKGRRDHSQPLWALWILELWHRRYIDHTPRFDECHEHTALPVPV